MFVKDKAYFSSSEKGRKKKMRKREMFVSKVERKCLILFKEVFSQNV